MAKSSAACFALGAATCAACFVLGGQSAAPSSPTKVIEVDKLVVRESIVVGSEGLGAHWYIRAGGDSANISGRVGAGKARFDLDLVGAKGGNAVLSLKSQGQSVDVLKPDNVLSLGMLDLRASRENKENAMWQVFMKFSKFPDTAWLEYKGGNEASWKGDVEQPASRPPG